MGATIDLCPLTPPPSSPSTTKKNAARRVNHGQHRKTGKTFQLVSCIGKHVKYWTLATVSSGKFNPSRLTERQQVAFIAAKSSAKDVDDFEASPYRLDRLASASSATPSALNRPRISSKMVDHRIDSEAMIPESELEHHTGKEPDLKQELQPKIELASPNDSPLLESLPPRVEEEIKSGDDFDYLAPFLATFYRAYDSIVRNREASKYT